MSKHWCITICLVILTALPAGATIINTTGTFVDDFNPALIDNHNPSTGVGWFSPSCANCLRGVGAATADMSQGPSGGRTATNGDGNWLDVKDTGNTGSWVAARAEFGTPSAPVDFSRFDGDSMVFRAAFLSGTFATGLIAEFGIVTISGGTSTTGFMSATADFGTLTTQNLFQQFSEEFSARAFNFNPTNWEILIRNVQLITINTSTHTGNSNDFIGIDEVGFTTAPEPSYTIALLVLGAAGVAVKRRRKV